MKTVEYHRKPTAGEVKFGEGAIHYLTIDVKDVTKADGTLKRWTKNPYNKNDHSRYYY
ncbi:hypothetical protein DSECCO2_268920 [anaerobic digester metagenome]